MKNAYLILTDLHYDVSKEHRLNYFDEVLSIIEQVIAIGEKYKARGYNTHLYFLGDVVDSSLSFAEDAMRCQDLFSYISTEFTSVCSVLGNHEENNITNNPFWYLVSSLEDEELSALPRPLQPKGIHTCIGVPAIREDGNVTFFFNHYGIPAKVPVRCEGKVNIGLFHQNVGSNDICKMWGTFVDVEQASFVHPYDYCFFGHMHLAEGKYKLNESGTCIGEWLGSCVGTTVREVQELNSSFNVPTVLVDDGVFLCVEENRVNRSIPDAVIDFTKLQLTQQHNKLLGEVKQLVMRDMSVHTLYERIKESADDNGMGFLVDMLSKEYDGLKHEYRLALKNTVGLEVENSGTGH